MAVCLLWLLFIHFCGTYEQSGKNFITNVITLNVLVKHNHNRHFPTEVHSFIYLLQKIQKMSFAQIVLVFFFFVFHITEKCQTWSSFLTHMHWMVDTELVKISILLHLFKELRELFHRQRQTGAMIYEKACHSFCSLHNSFNKVKDDKI